MSDFTLRHRNGSRLFPPGGHLITCSKVGYGHLAKRDSIMGWPGPRLSDHAPCLLTPLIDLFDFLEQLIIGEQLPVAGHDLLESDDSFFVDNEVGAFGPTPFFIKYAEGLHHRMAPKVT